MCRFAIFLLLAASPVFADDVRTLSGRHITLRTDVPSDPEVDALPAVFDQAFGQWCKYFERDPEDYPAWRANGILLHGPASRERFIAAGLMPAGLWDFKSGYSQGLNLWLYDQTSAYYRRHLLLHEGVHCFMNSLLGGSGPPWYAEGMAELLATHKLEDGKLTVNYFPQSRKEVPKLGRIELVREAVQGGRRKNLQEIAAYGATAHRDNEPYGWCWAATAFLDGHPKFRRRFHGLFKHVAKPDFAAEFARRFQQDQALLNEEWQTYLANLDYGYDFVRMQLDLSAGEPLPTGGKVVKVAADRGWQSSGIQLEAGRNYRVEANGRFQVANKPKPWISEAGGVTIRYVNGRPLGMLLGAVRPDGFDSSLNQTPLAEPQAIGRGRTLSPQVSGTLYLRINEAAGELLDNAGNLSVTVTALPN